MAGYILKIMMEDTHPPVWRRVIIPEMITFAELHQMIQILFGWSDSHLHDFRIPSQSVCIDSEEESWDRYHYPEGETLVDPFLLNHKWIRYTYDFGDEWRHKIIYEKTEEDYENRYASLLKVKGNNFQEDSGGAWQNGEEGWNRCGFCQPEVENRLKEFICPSHKELAETMEKEIAEMDMDKMVEGLIRKLCENFKEKSSKFINSNTPSVMSKKINKWKEFAAGESSRLQQKDSAADAYEQMTLPFIDREELETAGNVLEIVAGEKTQAQLLGDLGLKEAADYCKYLQIPAEDDWTKKQRTDTVARLFREHPEYILYVLDEEEYKDFLRWAGFPCGIVRERPEQDNTLIKAAALGLADITVQKTKTGCRAKLSFAKDLQSILEALKPDLRKKTYQGLKRFSSKFERLVLVYGLADMDFLFDTFCRVYHESMDRETFSRYVYWHVRFNELAQTGYAVDGTSYVCAVSLDMPAVLADMGKYAEDLDYVSFSAAELKRMSEDIAGRSDSVDILFTILHFQLEIPAQIAAAYLEDLFTSIMNGCAITTVLDKLYTQYQKEAELAAMCEIWQNTAALMLELELPMLKGRSRNQYAEEKGISAWQTGMLEETKDFKIFKDSKKSHMSEFPLEIQEAMYQASSFADKDDMRRLLRYQAKNGIMSEEFLYLLAEAHITGCEFDKAKKLIRKLERSSDRGKQAADILAARIENGWDAAEEDDDSVYFPDYFQKPDFEPVSQPYVRSAPKIGRNDPCPCGSGKKYKKCCGRNI